MAVNNFLKNKDHYKRFCENFIILKIFKTIFWQQFLFVAFNDSLKHY